MSSSPRVSFLQRQAGGSHLNMSYISPVEIAEQTTSLADQAYVAIRGLIVSLKMAPGALIDERRLDGEPRHRADARPRGAAPARAGAARRGVPAPRHVRHRRRRPRPRAHLRGARGARAGGRAARRRARDRRASATSCARSAEQIGRRGVDLMDLDERVHRAVYRAAHNDCWRRRSASTTSSRSASG